MFKCKKIYKFEYAHQLYSSYTSLCHETIHGHSGKVEIEFESYTLNGDGMVIDFGQISSVVKEKLMAKYDHALFMPKMFPEQYIDTLKKYNKRLTVTDINPTAENFAEWIFDDVAKTLKESLPDIKVKVSKVTFWETDTGCATYYIK